MNISSIYLHSFVHQSNLVPAGEILGMRLYQRATLCKESSSVVTFLLQNTSIIVLRDEARVVYDNNATVCGEKNSYMTVSWTNGAFFLHRHDRDGQGDCEG